MVTIEPMADRHAGDVLRIYGQGIAGGTATFETEVPSWEDFRGKRIPELGFVAMGDEAVLGWVAASPTSTRPAYRGVVDHSVYVDTAAHGRGVGRLLMNHFLAQADALGYWTVQSSLFPENEASRALHLATGFREVGRRERIARHGGTWRDTILVERRSPAVD